MKGVCNTYPVEFRFCIFFRKRPTASIASSSEALGRFCSDVKSSSSEQKTAPDLSADLKFFRFLCNSCEVACADCVMELSDFDTRAACEPLGCYKRKMFVLECHWAPYHWGNKFGLQNKPVRSWVHAILTTDKSQSTLYRKS